MRFRKPAKASTSIAVSALSLRSSSRNCIRPENCRLDRVFKRLLVKLSDRVLSGMPAGTEDSFLDEQFAIRSFGKQSQR